MTTWAPPRSGSTHRRVTSNGPVPSAAAPVPVTTFWMCTEPVRNVLVTSTTTGSSSVLPMVTAAGSTVLSSAPAASVSTTAQTEPVGMPLTVASKGCAPPRITSSSKTRRPSSLPSSSVQVTCTVKGPWPNQAAPGPVVCFTMTRSPESNQLVTWSSTVSFSTTVTTPSAGSSVTAPAPPEEVSLSVQTAPCGRPSYRAVKPVSSESDQVGCRMPRPRRGRRPN